MIRLVSRQKCNKNCSWKFISAMESGFSLTHIWLLWKCCILLLEKCTSYVKKISDICHKSLKRNIWHNWNNFSKNWSWFFAHQGHVTLSHCIIFCETFCRKVMLPMLKHRNNFELTSFKKKEDLKRMCAKILRKSLGSEC